MPDYKTLNIQKIQNENENMECAKLMSSNEPWITLKRPYNECLEMLSNKTLDFFVGYINNEFTGFVVINMQGAFRGYIQTLAVKEAWRNKGIGTELIKFAESFILEKTPNVFICVSSFNQKAKKLYEKLGYELIGELKDYVIKGHSEYLLRKTISPLYDFFHDKDGKTRKFR